MPWAPSYATVPELRDYVRIPAGDTADDVHLALAVESASRAIDHHTNRQFGQVVAAEPRVYTARYDRRRARWVIDTDDISSNVGLLVDVDDDDDQVYDQPVDSFRLYPLTAPELGLPWEAIVVHGDSTNLPSHAEGGVRVTAVWGWPSVPDTIKQATLLQGSRFFWRQQAPQGVAGSPDMGSEVRLLQKVDVDVAVMLRSYIRWWGAV